ncbi:MAG: preprotein translocase subunit YajC [Bdellovibrionaceae bacterium]|nr:preprotein translocase subunit YajC [Pseudobdellovibrionaceae bacterium]
MGEQFFPFIVVIGLFYFLMLRPQIKRQKQHHEFLSGMKRGQQVLTSSGILGTIEGLTDQFVVLEVADGVRIRIQKTAISGPAKEDEK